VERTGLAQGNAGALRKDEHSGENGDGEDHRENVKWQKGEKLGE
jgi:hypothetical protein